MLFWSWAPVALLALAVIGGVRRWLSRLVTEPQRRPDPLGDRLRACAAVRAGGDAEIETLVLSEPRDGSGWRLERVAEPIGHARLGATARLCCWRAWRPDGGAGAAGSARRRGTVVLLHGFSDGSHRMSRAAMVAIDNGWEAMLVDLPGHGLSPGRHATFGKREARALDAMLGAMRRDEDRFPIPFVLLGYSYGASMSIATLLHQHGIASPAIPPRAERDSVDDDNHLSVAGAILTAPYWDLRATMHRHAARYLGIRAPRLIDAAIAQSERRLGLAVDEMGPSAWLSATTRPGSSAAPFPPAIVLRGDSDTLLLDHDAEALARAWPGKCRVVTLAGQSHDGVWEDDATLAALPSWLDEFSLPLAQSVAQSSAMPLSSTGTIAPAVPGEPKSLPPL
jgi:hypothetical protein